MALIRQTDRRTGTVYVYEAEARWDPEKKQSRYGRRKLVGHVDPRTGEVVPNRPTRAPSPGPRREFYGACALLDAAAGESGVAAALGRALPHGSDQVLSLAHYMICEGSAPLSRFPRYAATHATPHGAPIASQRSSELLASIGEAERDAFCSALAGRHGRATGSSTTRRRYRRTPRPSPRSGGAATRTACRCRRPTWRCWWGRTAACRCTTARWRAT